MNQINFRMDESVVLRSNHVNQREGSDSTGTGDLTLTNQRLVFAWVTPKLFSRSVTHENVYQLSRVKVVEGRPQMHAGKLDSSYPELELDLITETVSFSFFGANKSESKKELAKWMDAISMQLIGQPSQEAAAIRKTIPSIEMFASVLKGTIDTFKETVGVKGTASAEPKLVTSKCIGCRAPVTGRIGQTVRCQYCDTRQTL